MQVDLRECETVVLNLPEDNARRESASAICDRLDLSWRLIDAIKCSPGRIGCGLSHLRALRQATPGRALVILEDDIGVSESYAPVIEAPDDADAIYLGASIYGAIDLVDYVGFTNMLAADPAGENLVRVYNLLSTHAILYISEAFKTAAAESVLRSLIDRDWEHDKGMAKLQESFNVYALRRPIFFQAARLQLGGNPHQEEVTKIVLDPSAIGAKANLGIGEDWRPATLVRSEGRPRWCWDE